MRYNLIFLVVLLLHLASCQDSEESRGFHKKKRRPFQQGSPCGGFRDAGSIEDSRSLHVVTALGAAAVGYHLGMKHHNQPIINNIITTGGGGGGGFPCGGIAQPIPPPIFSSGLLASSSSVVNPLLGGAFGGSRNNVNWNRMIRQFNRDVIRPITRWF